jgi:DNA-binding LytR/AlgR family response regulator
MAQLLERLEQINRQLAPVYLNWIKASRGDEIHLIPVIEVLYFNASDKYVSLYKRESGGTSEYLLRTSLRELQT